MVTVLQLLIIHEMLENSNCQVTLCFSLTKCTCLLMYYKLIGCMLLSLAEPILSATKQSVNYRCSDRWNDRKKNPVKNK